MGRDRDLFHHPHLQMASLDFRYLLNRGYPRKPSLELVGNRYHLTSNERHLLHRGVFSDEDSRMRRARKIPFLQIRGKNLAIDGYNVLITVEAGLSGRPLILGDDGFIRDISGLSGNYRRSRKTDEALSLILNLLKRIRPRYTLFLLDAPISRSGELADDIRKRMEQEGIPGRAQAIKVPEKILEGFPGVVATSDTAILDRCERAHDLAGTLLKQRGSLGTMLRWAKRTSRPGKRGASPFPNGNEINS